MSEQHSAVLRGLQSIELAMRQSDLWQTQIPTAEELASIQPFAVDRLALHQWLQFIFIPQMSIVVEQQLPLPQSCAIAPMAETVYASSSADLMSLIDALRQFDALFNA